MVSEPLNSITQGSIVDGVDFGFEEAPLGIILSNECDFINDKLGYVLVACLVPACETICVSKEFMNRMEGVNENGEISKKKWEKLKNFFDDYIHNKGISRFYFINLSPVLDAPYMLVDFQHLVSIPANQLSSLECVAQLDSPYREQMMVHFASYTARIPVDRVDDTTEIAKALLPNGYVVKE